MAFQPAQATSRGERLRAAPLLLACRLGAVLLSFRGLSALAFLGCGLLAIGPWMRPAVSRDFRGIHIPWNNTSDASFLPELVSQVPRPWRWDSVATPLLLVAFCGVLFSVCRPRWTNALFGLLLTLSIPAFAAVLWNHPGLVEFLDGEVRERGMLRVVYRHRNEDTLTNCSPDRLRNFGERDAHDKSELPVHPLIAPFRYVIYGPWLVIAAFVGTAITRIGTWPQRLASAATWAVCGCILAALVTAPRWAAEYHWARAEAAENANRLPVAEQSLACALRAMPQLAGTSRHWLTAGRLAYRQHDSNRYADYFQAYQLLEVKELSQARAVLEHSISSSGAETVQRSLLAEVIGQVATRYGMLKKYGAAEIAWGQAAEIAPWKPAYSIGHFVTILASNPLRAPEMEDAVVARLRQIGDCFVSSDLAAMLGDAYFEGGDYLNARDMYAEAVKIFDLPKYVNLHAQEGRLGM